MATSINNNEQWVVRSTTLERLVVETTVDIGASGAATLNAIPGFLTCAKSATGVYDITFEPFPSAAGVVFEAGILVSATPTVSQATCLAFSATAGTAQIKTALNAAATGVEPASGDKLWLRLSGSALT